LGSNNVEAARVHWIKYGHKEGRDCSCKNASPNSENDNIKDTTPSLDDTSEQQVDNSDRSGEM